MYYFWYAQIKICRYAQCAAHSFSHLTATTNLKSICHFNGMLRKWYIWFTWKSHDAPHCFSIHYTRYCFSYLQKSQKTKWIREWTFTVYCLSSNVHCTLYTYRRLILLYRLHQIIRSFFVFHLQVNKWNNNMLALKRYFVRIHVRHLRNKRFSHAMIHLSASVSHWNRCTFCTPVSCNIVYIAYEM